MAQAIKVGPGAASVCAERRVKHGGAQARPCAQVLVQGCGRVAIPHRSGNDRNSQPMAIRIKRSHAFAPQYLFACIMAARPAHRDALDALWSMMAKRGVQALIQPAPKPAIHGAPGRHAWRQSPPDFVLPEVRSLVPLLYPGSYI